MRRVPASPTAQTVSHSGPHKPAQSRKLSQQGHRLELGVELQAQPDPLVARRQCQLGTADLRLPDLGPSNLDSGHDHDKADFLWLQAPAYAGGELVNEMNWAWGEAPLRHNARKQGRVLLIGVAKENACQRSWSGFTRVQHEAQNPRITFKRYLTPEEVAAYLA